MDNIAGLKPFGPTDLEGGPPIWNWGARFAEDSKGNVVVVECRKPHYRKTLLDGGYRRPEINVVIFDNDLVVTLYEAIRKGLETGKQQKGKAGPYGFIFDPGGPKGEFVNRRLRIGCTDLAGRALSRVISYGKANIGVK